MSAKQFEHFLQFHRQLASLRRTKRPAKSPATARAQRPAAVAAAKQWLAGAGALRPYSL